MSPGACGAMIARMTLTPDDVRRATDRFAAGLVDAEAEAAVPACPGWTVRDLVAHLGNVHAWAGRIVEAGGPVEAPDEQPADSDLAGWYAARADRLVRTLAAADPEGPCWNFAGVDQRRGFWSRRQVHETLMHLVDLDQAHARTTDLEPDHCADGVSETLEVFLPRMHGRGHPADLAGPVSLRATDTGHGWTLSPRDGEHPGVTQGPGVPAEDRLEGTAEQLWLLLWKRGDDVVRIGDADRLTRLLASRLTA